MVSGPKSVAPGPSYKLPPWTGPDRPKELRILPERFVGLLTRPRRAPNLPRAAGFRTPAGMAPSQSSLPTGPYTCAMRSSPEKCFLSSAVILPISPTKASNTAPRSPHATWGFNFAVGGSCLPHKRGAFDVGDQHRIWEFGAYLDVFQSTYGSRKSRRGISK